MNTSRTKYIAKTFLGLESVAAEELANLGASDVRILNRSVEFWGDKALLYKTNYCCRSVLRILQPIASFSFASNEQFYKQVFKIPFEQYLSKNGTFCMHSVISNAIFDNSQYASLLAKDALCDRFREKYDCRPSVDKQYPDVSVDIYISGNDCSVAIDSSGESLHRRGYKTTRHPAALNEVLAAGLVLLSGWKADCDLVDFMCGSATIPIEAAMYALNMPAGYFRKDFGFMYWKDFDEKLWKNVQNDAKNAMRSFDFKVYGSDISFNFIKNARENVKKMGLSEKIILSIESFEDVQPERLPVHVIINPPYGERLKNDIVENFYQNIGDKLKQTFVYSIAWVITPNKEAMKNFGLHPTRKIRVFNAALECTFYKFEIYEGSKKRKYNKEEN